MGSKKTETTTTTPVETKQTVTPQLAPGQQELIDIQLEKQRALAGPTTALDLQGIELISSIFAGEPLQGGLAPLTEVIPELAGFPPCLLDPS